MAVRQALRSFDLTIRRSNYVRLSFLMTELDVGITFAKIALESGNEDTRTRNRRNARKAYDTALHFLPKIRETQAEDKQINGKLATLKTFLQSLGETF